MQKTEAKKITKKPEIKTETKQDLLALNIKKYLTGLPGINEIVSTYKGKVEQKQIQRKKLSSSLTNTRKAVNRISKPVRKTKTDDVNKTYFRDKHTGKWVVESESVNLGEGNGRFTIFKFRKEEYEETLRNKEKKSIETAKTAVTSKKEIHLFTKRNIGKKRTEIERLASVDKAITAQDDRIRIYLNASQSQNSFLEDLGERFIKNQGNEKINRERVIELIKKNLEQILAKKPIKTPIKKAEPKKLPVKVSIKPADIKKDTKAIKPKAKTPGV